MITYTLTPEQLKVFNSIRNIPEPLHGLPGLEEISQQVSARFFAIIAEEQGVEDLANAKVIGNDDECVVHFFSKGEEVTL